MRACQAWGSPRWQRRARSWWRRRSEDGGRGSMVETIVVRGRGGGQREWRRGAGCSVNLTARERRSSVDGLTGGEGRLGFGSLGGGFVVVGQGDCMITFCGCGRHRGWVGRFWGRLGGAF